jgi:hypothetical protein
VPEIVTRIVAAHASSSLKEGRLPYAVVARRAVVAVDKHTNRVTLSLMPTDELHLPFSMATSLALKTAEALREAVSTLERRTLKKASLASLT